MILHVPEGKRHRIIRKEWSALRFPGCKRLCLVQGTDLRGKPRAFITISHPSLLEHTHTQTHTHKHTHTNTHTYTSLLFTNSHMLVCTVCGSLPTRCVCVCVCVCVCAHKVGNAVAQRQHVPHEL